MDALTKERAQRIAKWNGWMDGLIDVCVAAAVSVSVSVWLPSCPFSLIVSQPDRHGRLHDSIDTSEV